MGNDLNSENTWNEGFCFLSRGFLIFKRGKTKLREVWPYYSMFKIREIIGKIGFQFCKLTFSGVDEQAICKFT